MKKFKLLLSGFFIVALVTSCSKDQDTPVDDSEMATLSFGAIVNDLAAKASSKQSEMDIPECSDADPAYVEIIVSNDDGVEVVGSTEEPFRVDLVDGQVFTEEVPELELEPGTYSLDHFMVFDASGNIIWIAPTGGPMADFVDAPLPMTIELGAGVKKYVDVSVLCFDDRDVNLYGYLFFDIDTNEAIEFCLFGNYCDETGRHFAAEYSVDVWAYSDDTMGEQLYDDLMNVVDVDENGDMAASPLCIALPDTEGVDEYYFEVTLLDGEDYNATEEVVRAGVITDTEVRTFFDGENNLEYYHFRTGCENNDNVPVLQDPDDGAEYYEAHLTELNSSDAFALAYLRLEGNTLETTVLAYNVEGGMIHPQHIHGFEDDHNATCPTLEEADGANGGTVNGLIELAEGAPFYGPVMLSLTVDGEDSNWPVANEWGMYMYSHTFTLSDDVWTGLDPLESKAMVVHGMTVDGEYWATLPVACGQIWSANPEDL